MGRVCVPSSPKKPAPGATKRRSSWRFVWIFLEKGGGAALWPRVEKSRVALRLRQVLTVSSSRRRQGHGTIDDDHNATPSTSANPAIEGNCSYLLLVAVCTTFSSCQAGGRTADDCSPQQTLWARLSSTSIGRMEPPPVMRALASRESDGCWAGTPGLGCRGAGFIGTSVWRASWGRSRGQATTRYERMR